MPVAWLPAVSVPDPTVRYATGLLTPEFGNSTKIGYFTRLPLYVALSPSQDSPCQPPCRTSHRSRCAGQLVRREVVRLVEEENDALEVGCSKAHAIPRYDEHRIHTSGGRAHLERGLAERSPS